jgi:class 3 adenylate cyclase
VSWNDVGLSELPTGTVTLLLADVDGSARWWGAQPEQMATQVERLDRARSAIVRADG